MVQKKSMRPIKYVMMGGLDEETAENTYIDMRAGSKAVVQNMQVGGGVVYKNGIDTGDI